MARSILLIASNSDYNELLSCCAQLGLHLLPMQLGLSVKEPEGGAACYLGHVTEAELHPFGKPPVRVTDVKDPLLLFIRPYHSPPYLTDGCIVLNEANKEVSEQIRPTFEKLRRWVRKNWHKTSQHSSYIGPEAISLLNSGQALWRSHLHNAQGHIVVVNAR